MNRLIGWLVLALVAAILMPVLSAYAMKAIPALVGLLILLVIAKFAWPVRPH